MSRQVEQALESYVLEWTQSGKRPSVSFFNLTDEGRIKLKTLIQEFHQIDQMLSQPAPYAPNVLNRAANPSHSDFELPQGFDGIELLGSGAFGSVIKARDTQLNRIVAIKVLRSITPHQEEDLLREAQILEALKCDKIPIVYSVFINKACIITEYIEGVDLCHFNHGKKRHELEIRQIIKIMLNVAGIIEKAHSKGIIHADIKPGNIRLDASLTPHLLDFGLAQSMGEPHHGWGSVGYSAPEQYREVLFANQLTDLFSLGAVFYELVCGQKIYDSPETAGVHPPDILQSFRSECPPSFKAVLLKCLETNPVNRYQSATELVGDLQNILDGKEVSARPTFFRTTLNRNVQKHLDEIGDWEKQGLIFHHEKQALQSQYSRLKKPLDDWLPDNRLLTLDQIVLYLGVVVLLFGSGYLFYAHHFLNITTGWLYPTAFFGISFAVLNLANNRLQEAKTVKIAYDIAALNILPLLLFTLFGELNWFQLEGPESFRLFSLFTNFQIQVTFAFVFIWNILRVRRNKTLALTNMGVIIFCILYCSILLGFGLKIWILDGDYHLLATHLIPLLLVLTYVGILSEHQKESLLSRPCYSVAAASMVIILELYALNGKTMELLSLNVRLPHEAPEGFDPVFFNTILGCTINGILIYLIARKLTTNSSPIIRQQGSWLLLITPFLLLEPLSWLVFSNTYGVFYHWFYLLVSLSILFLSRTLQRKSFYFAGMINLVLAIHAITIHYEWLEQTAWPIALLGVGSLFLVLGYRLFIKRNTAILI